MTENQIERRVERMVDGLDARFLSSSMTQAEYDDHMRQIDEWVQTQYRAIDALRKRDL